MSDEPAAVAVRRVQLAQADEALGHARPPREPGEIEKVADRRAAHLRRIGDIGYDIGILDQRRKALEEELIRLAAEVYDDGLSWPDIHKAFADQAGDADPTRAQLYDAASKLATRRRTTASGDPDQQQGSLLQ